VENAPENDKCCIVFETDIFDGAEDKFSKNYICSSNPDEAKCVIEAK